MNKIILVLINGHAGVGKDTFVDFCKEYAEEAYHCSVTNIHRSDLPKSALYMLGWNGWKDTETRTLLKNLVDWMENKGLLNQHLQRTLNKIQRSGELVNIVFYHVRDPEAMYKIMDEHIHTSLVRPISLLIRRDTISQEPEDWWNDLENAEYMMTLETKTDEWIGVQEAAKGFVDFVVNTDWIIAKKEDNNDKTKTKI